MPSNYNPWNVVELEPNSIARLLIQMEYNRSREHMGYRYHENAWRGNLRNLMRGYALPSLTQYQMWQLRQMHNCYVHNNATTENTNTTSESENPMEDTIDCGQCGEGLDPRDATIIDNNAYHNDCTVECESCEEQTPSDDSVADGFITLCQNCYDSSFITCEDCDRIVSEWNTISEDRCVCEHCTDNGDYHYCDGYGYAFGSESDCDDCSGSDEYMHNYSYKPDPLFHDMQRNAPSRIALSGVRYYGIELETVPSRNHDRSDASQYLWETVSEDLAYQKEDGSISDGFEIVTHPMSLDYAMMNFPWAVLPELANRGMRAWNDSRCGLHIHISRTSFRTQTHLAKFLLFVYRNRDDMVKFTGRHSHYADYSWSERSNFVNNAKGNRYGDRHVAVNCRNDHTVELRVFRPSLQPTTVQAYIQFCDALIEYTQSITTGECVRDNALSFPKFMAWTATRHEYSVLHERLLARIMSESTNS